MKKIEERQERKTDRQTVRQIDRQTGRQTVRQSDRQTINGTQTSSDENNFTTKKTALEVDNCLERCLKRSRGAEHSVSFQGKIHFHFQSLSTSGAQLVFLSCYVAVISKSVPVGWENVRKDEQMFFSLHPVSFFPHCGNRGGLFIKKGQQKWTSHGKT